MNPMLASELAECHIRDLRRAAASRANRPAGGERRAGPHRPAPLRHQLGFALIETGLRLVCTTEAAGLNTSS